MQEAAAKEKAARDKHDQLLKLANQAERARQDTLAKTQEDSDNLKQSYEVKKVAGILWHYIYSATLCASIRNKITGTTTLHFTFAEVGNMKPSCFTATFLPVEA